ncbi:uncharacterized protein RMCN_2839 [Mycolicibacterium novocastrense]|uniref:Uncharacterized protein n=1 Tax=Mycolicibacterium novocastrense TaxID=59813 RepID=A0ABQ0KJI0_MYCNV|nr:uncharacterized protein RMCN_2839 [Mycolicibacterium novocastrense]
MVAPLTESTFSPPMKFWTLKSLVIRSSLRYRVGARRLTVFGQQVAGRQGRKGAQRIAEGPRDNYRLSSTVLIEQEPNQDSTDPVDIRGWVPGDPRPHGGNATEFVEPGCLGAPRLACGPGNAGSHRGGLVAAEARNGTLVTYGRAPEPALRRDHMT